jgi:aminopeptidase
LILAPSITRLNQEIRMTDSRVIKLANVLVHYSLELKPGQQFVINTHPWAEELTLAVYEAAIKAGANVLVQSRTPGAEEIYYKYASDDQLDHVSPTYKLIAETFDASLSIWTVHNTRSLAGIDPSRMARASKAGAGVFKTFLNRMAKGEMRWCGTSFPTHASAQEADMSLRDYQDFVYGSEMLDEDDPVAYWKNIGQDLRRLADMFKGHDQVILKGPDIDLKMSIKDRRFIPCDGKENFPDGEIFTGPVEDSVEGWVRFHYPAIENGQEVTDIQLWFEKGKVVKEAASKNQELLTAQLNTDAGARYLGEFGIGTNYGITRFTKDMLFDEKMGGTIHLAVGAGLPESGSKNESGIHWDMLCNMKDAEIRVDNELFYKNGKFII